MLYCSACNAMPDVGLDCPSCLLPLSSTEAPEPTDDEYMALQWRRLGRTVAAITCGVLAAVAYACTEKTGAHAPGIACAVFMLAAVVLAPTH